MVTVLRVRRLRIVIYSNDHWPPHVHVIGPGSEAKVALGEPGEHPRLVTNDGLSRAELVSALLEIDEQRDLLMQRWREIHGDA
ncbi:MAG: DUF4160 domain-containing protein [Gammaproteobacteria bacterium]